MDDEKREVNSTYSQQKLQTGGLFISSDKHKYIRI